MHIQPSSKNLNIKSSLRINLQTTSAKFAGTSSDTSKHRSSIRGMNTFRGFNFSQIYEQHEIAQGKKEIPITPQAEAQKLVSKGFQEYVESEYFGSSSSPSDSVSDSNSSYFVENGMFKFHINKSRVPSVHEPSPKSENFAQPMAPKFKSKAVPLNQQPLHRKVAWIVKEEKKYSGQTESAIISKNYGRKLTELSETENEESNASGLTPIATEEAMIETPKFKNLKQIDLESPLKPKQNNLILDPYETVRNDTLNDTSVQETSRNLMNKDTLR